MPPAPGIPKVSKAEGQPGTPACPDQPPRCGANNPIASIICAMASAIASREIPPEASASGATANDAHSAQTHEERRRDSMDMDRERQR
ncbi:hypothetical protein McPS_22770 [Marichromatium sp. PS1]